MSFISHSFYEKLISKGTKIVTKQLEKPCEIIMGNQGTSFVTQTAILSLKINDGLFCIQALILNMLPFEVVLGMNFLQKYKAIINFDLCKINLIPNENRSNPIDAEKCVETQGLLNHDCELPPGCETIVEIKSTDPNLTTALVQNSLMLSERLMVFVAKGLIQLKGNKSLVIISNLGRKHISLPKETIIGTLTPADTQDFIDCTAQAMPTNYSKYKLFSMTKSKDTKQLPQGLDLNDTNCDENELKQLKQLISKYKDCFSSTPKSPKPAIGITHTIDTGNSKPINSAPYRASPAQRKVIESQIEDMLNNNIIEPSKSPWASLIVLVDKKDGSIRFCVDYRKLNTVTKRDVYPLPRIDDCLNAIGGNKYFSTFDLAAGYWQILMNKEDKEKTAFISHHGLYQFNVMSFGLKNAPATFQRFMDNCFAGLKWRTLLVYLDDIFVFSSNFKQHLKDLEEVFKRVKENCLSFKASICFLCKPELNYLGHVISKEGIQPDPDSLSLWLRHSLGND